MGTRESEQPIQRISGNWLEARVGKSFGCSSEVLSPLLVLLDGEFHGAFVTRLVILYSEDREVINVDRLMSVEESC